MSACRRSVRRSRASLTASDFVHVLRTALGIFNLLRSTINTFAYPTLVCTESLQAQLFLRTSLPPDPSATASKYDTGLLTKPACSLVVCRRHGMFEVSTPWSHGPAPVRRFGTDGQSEGSAGAARFKSNAGTAVLRSAATALTGAGGQSWLGNSENGANGPAKKPGSFWSKVRGTSRRERTDVELPRDPL